MALDTSEFKGRFGFGAMRLPMKGTEPDYDTINELFDAFLDAGLNYFDTAFIHALLGIYVGYMVVAHTLQKTHHE